MTRTDAVTRILFEAFSAAEVRLFYALGYAAIAVFCYGVYVQIRKYRRGAALHLEGSLGIRLRDMAGAVLSHRTLDRRDRAAGGAHRLIFYGFALLFLGTATITLEYDILEPLFGLRFWHGEFYLWFSLVLDVAGVALVGGLAYMMYRRSRASPRSPISTGSSSSISMPAPSAAAAMRPVPRAPSVRRCRRAM